ncbi:MAG: hypothetical protein DRO88_07630 [Promethearchaeia archaeon]|nr:MAG: hypothetical protein DRO88_07630 [Candidatus Lokiarchaeia archaeon]
MSQQQDEMPTLEGMMTALPATILNLLDVDIPPFLTPPIQTLIDLFKPRGINRIIINLIDQFGLFEITVHKPPFLISQADALVLLSTSNPYLHGVLFNTFFGGFDFEPNGFHLLRHLQEHGKSTVFVGRERDIQRYNGGTPSIAKSTDMATWIEGAKVVNRNDLSILHYLDFEDISAKGQKTSAKNLEELSQKLIKRTDKWLKSTFLQLRSKSLMVVLSNHGRYKIDLNYQGKAGEWRSASVPLAIFMYKE